MTDHVDWHSTYKNMSCDYDAFQVHSNGIWMKTDDPKWWLNKAFPLLQLQLVLIFLLTQMFHFGLRRFGVTKPTSQILTGLVLGVSWNKLDWVKHQLFIPKYQRILETMSTLGYTYFLFITAVKMDVTMIRRTGRKAMTLGIVSRVLPLICGMGFQFLFNGSFTPPEKKSLLTVTVIQSSIPFPVISYIISELEIVNSELGRIGLSAALVSDAISFSLRAITTMIGSYSILHNRVFLDLASLIAFGAFAFGIRQVSFWIIKQTPEGKPVRDMYVYWILLLTLFSALLSTGFNQTALFGPFFLGLLLPDGPPLGSVLVEKLECFMSDILLPVFVTICAIRVDLITVIRSVRSSYLTKCNVLLAVAIYAFKVISALIPSLSFKLPFKDSLSLSLILSYKSVVELAAYVSLRDSNTVTEGVFGILVLSTFFIATMVPVAVRHLYDPSTKHFSYQRRTVMNSKSKSELRVLATINRNENISSVINLLDATNPSTDNLLAIFVLHLIELIGRASPIFISHKMQGISSYSENMILSFNRFKKEHRDVVAVECFTAISPSKFMHEDICNVALEKHTALIILPFHQTLSLDGAIQADDKIVRNLNINMLNRSPCSVAIFVERGRLGRSSPIWSSRSNGYSICVIFLGGEDDWEALSLARRMANDSKVRLSIVNIVSPEGDAAASKWGKRVDFEFLNGVRLNTDEEGHVMYYEHVVKDGPETAFVLRSLVGDNYDLLVVGRRHEEGLTQTEGLTEWSEFPELGVIGDLLASTDMQSTTSILVIQRQISVS